MIDQTHKPCSRCNPLLCKMVNQKELFESACKIVLKDTLKMFATEAWKQFEEKDPMICPNLKATCELCSAQKY